MTVIANNPDIHVLTGSLKLFFRELKEPLIPCSVFDRILAACCKYFLKDEIFLICKYYGQDLVNSINERKKRCPFSVILKND